MKSVVRRLFINFEKEEKWLNDMTAKGMHFIDYSFGRYLFEEGEPGEYIYRLELLDQLPSHPESIAYIKFMEEAGIECVGSYMRWVYFRKKASEGPFDLYSDYDSRIKYYKKIISLVGVLGFVNLLAAIGNVVAGLEIGFNRGPSFNMFISLANWAVVITFIPMFVSYLRKIKKMKEEKKLYE